MPAGNTNASRARVAEILARSRAMTAARRPRMPLEGIAPPPAWAQAGDRDPLPAHWRGIEVPIEEPAPSYAVPGPLGQRPAFENFTDTPLANIPAPSQEGLDRYQATDDFMRGEAEAALQTPAELFASPISNILFSPEARQRLASGQSLDAWLASMGLGGNAGNAETGPEFPLDEIVQAGRGALHGAIRGSARPDPLSAGVAMGSAVAQGGAQMADALGQWWNDEDNTFSRPARMGQGLFEFDPASDHPLGGYGGAFLEGVTVAPWDMSEDARQGLAWENARRRAVSDNGEAVLTDASRGDAYADQMNIAGANAAMNLAFTPGDAAAVAGLGRIGAREAAEAPLRAERATSPIESIRDVPFQASEQAPELVARSPQERVGEDVLSGVGTGAQRVSGPEGYIEYEVKPDGWHITNVSVNRDIGDGQGLYARLMESAQANGAEILMGRRHAQGSAPLSARRDDLPTTVYHATTVPVEGPLFDGVGILGRGAYSSRSPEIADVLLREAGEAYPEGANIVPERVPSLDRYVPFSQAETDLAQMAQERGLDLDSAHMGYSDVEGIQNELLARYREQGYVGIHDPDYADGLGQLVTWEGRNRRAPWAAMSTSAMNSPDPLASVGPLLGIGAGAALGGAAGNALLSDANASDGSEGGGIDPLGTVLGMAAGGFIGGRLRSPAIQRLAELPSGSDFMLTGDMHAFGRTGRFERTGIGDGTDYRIARVFDDVGDAEAYASQHIDDVMAVTTSPDGRNMVVMKGIDDYADDVGETATMIDDLGNEITGSPEEINNLFDQGGLSGIQRRLEEAANAAEQPKPARTRTPRRPKGTPLNGIGPLALGAGGAGAAAYDYLDNGEFDGLGQSGLAAIAIGPLGRGRGARAVEEGAEAGARRIGDAEIPQRVINDTPEPLRGVSGTDAQPVERVGRTDDPRLTPDQNYILWRLRLGESRDQIAADMQTSLSSIGAQLSYARRRAPDLDIPHGSNARRAGEGHRAHLPTIERILEMRGQGLSYQQISERTGSSVESLATRVSRHKAAQRRRPDPLAGIAIGGGALLAADAVSGGASAETLSDGREVRPMPEGVALSEGNWMEPGWAQTTLSDGTPAVTRTLLGPDGRSYIIVGRQNEQTAEIDFLGTTLPEVADSDLPNITPEMRAAIAREIGGGASDGAAYIQGLNRSNERSQSFELSPAERQGLSTATGTLLGALIAGRRPMRGAIVGGVLAGAADYALGGDEQEAAIAGIPAAFLAPAARRGVDYLHATTPESRARIARLAESLSDEPRALRGVTRGPRALGLEDSWTVSPLDEPGPIIASGDEMVEQGYSGAVRNNPSLRAEFLARNPIEQLRMVGAEDMREARRLGQLQEHMSAREDRLAEDWGRVPIEDATPINPEDPTAARPGGNIHVDDQGRSVFGERERKPRPPKPPRPPVDERVLESGAAGGLQGVPVRTLRNMAEDYDIETQGMSAAELRRTMQRVIGHDPELDSSRSLIAYLKRYGVPAFVATSLLGSDAADPLENVTISGNARRQPSR